MKKKDVENYVYKLRVKHNLSQLEMSQRLNCSQGYLSKVENNEKVADTNFIISLRKEFNLNINRMIDNGILNV